jgi:zeta-carotene desaturase
MAQQRVVVVGGGLAGMAAAVALQSAGISVTLLEARKTLGGRAGSFEDPQTGEILDNCQHVLLGCCTNLLDFYRRTGVLDRIRWERTIRFVDPRGKPHCLWSVDALPAPLNLAASAATFTALNQIERLSLGRAMLAMLRLGPQDRGALADMSFGQWLDEHDQPVGLIEKFYELVLVSALNEHCRRASAAYAIQVFQEGMLAHKSAYRMGTPACALGQLYEHIPCGDLRLGTRMTGLRFDGQRVVGVQIGEDFVAADAVVLATAQASLDKWIPGPLLGRDSRFVGLDQLETVPILGAHLWFDRMVLPWPHAALMGGPLQWLFAKPGGDGRAVHGVISAARDWTGIPREECLDIFVRQIRNTLAPAKEAKLIRGVIVVEKRATFSPLPGVDRLRPTQAPPPGGIAGLFLAGDYTHTGWPATMEGAVRSGYLAAESVLNQPGKFLVPPLAPQWPARLLRRS